MQIKDWPLARHAEATLVAAGSPDALGHAQQWRTHAYFLTESGSTFDLRLPWGLLPKLRPGSVFVDGHLTGYAVALEERELEISTEPQIVSWAQATKNELGWMREEALQNEHCLVFDLAQGRAVLPCVQALRAFHAQTRTSAHAILRPTVLRELATGELIGDEAKLHIARFVPRGVMTKVFARYLAKLVFEQEWLESFSGVFNRRLAEAERASDKHARVPLICIPPRSPLARWNVAGHRLASGDFFVSDVVGTQSSSQPPYRTLTIIHNKRTPAPKRPKDSLSVDADAEGNSSKPGRRSRNDDPKKVGRPLLVRLRAIQHDDSGSARIFDLYPGKKPATEQPDGGTRRKSGDAHSIDDPVSLDEERGTGSRVSAEFVGGPGRDTTPPHFDVFVNAFRQVVEARHGWTIHFRIESLSDYIANCQPPDRLVMFGRLKTPNAFGFLVELEPLQDQTSYTLAVLRRSDPESATIKDIGSRLSSWLSVSGRSRLQELLKVDADYRVLLSTHRRAGTNGWVERILDKFDAPARRPAWTRGVAE